MYDLFICHASEDKEAVARPLAQALQGAVSVWYDEFTLELGDSLRASIDKGLAESRYGLVVLSLAFFAKNWPQAELNGLFAKEISGTKTILTVWHQIGRKEILKFSPILADKFAAKTEHGLDSVVQQILDVIKPEELHLTRDLKTLSLVPSSIRLHGGGWEIKTPVTVTNLSRFPVHDIKVQLILHPPGLKSQSVKVEPVGCGPEFEENIGGYTLNCDLVSYHLVDPGNQQSLVFQIRYLQAGSSKVFQVWGTEPIESRADIRLCGFSDKPAEIFCKDGQIAIPFKLP